MSETRDQFYAARAAREAEAARKRSDDRVAHTAAERRAIEAARAAEAAQAHARQLKHDAAVEQVEQRNRDASARWWAERFAPTMEAGARATQDAATAFSSAVARLLDSGSDSAVLKAYAAWKLAAEKYDRQRIHARTVMTDAMPDGHNSPVNPAVAAVSVPDFPKAYAGALDAATSAAAGAELAEFISDLTARLEPIPELA